MLLSVNIDDKLYFEFKMFLLRNRLKSKNVISSLIKDRININNTFSSKEEINLDNKDDLKLNK